MNAKFTVGYILNWSGLSEQATSIHGSIRNSEDSKESYEVEREYGRNTSQHHPGWPSRKKNPDIAT